jgi:glutamine synthetase
MSVFEYIWIDGDGNFRNKTKVGELENWNYDGSSTGQANTENSEVILKPVFTCLDPFRGGNSKLVLCDTWISDDQPHPTNTRAANFDIFEKHKDKRLMFGFEQEFFVKGLRHKDTYPHYCNVQFGTNGFVEKAFQNCLAAGLDVTGMNSEVVPDQWEIQVCSGGITACDQLMVLRYILQRSVPEVDFHPKPHKDQNGSGCHINFSTDNIRKENYDLDILVSRFVKRHREDIKNYGQFNELRLTGTHETSNLNKFTWGKGDRTASMRINKGYFEDRRPASNIDPYVATSTIVKTLFSSSY